jgi:hypothetical protein
MYISRGFDSRLCLWNFSLTESFRPHYGPGVDSASYRNEYQEYFLRRGRGEGGMRPVRGVDNLPLLIVLKFWSLNLLETSGPVQASTEIPLSLLYV